MAPEPILNDWESIFFFLLFLPPPICLIHSFPFRMILFCSFSPFFPLPHTFPLLFSLLLPLLPQLNPFLISSAVSQAMIDPLNDNSENQQTTKNQFTEMEST